MKVLVAHSPIPITACCNKNPSLPSLFPSPFIKFPVSYKLRIKGLSFTPRRCISSLPTIQTSSSSSLSSNTKRCWVVVLETPPQNVASSKQEFVNHCVSTLERVLGSEKDAQMSIYDVFHGDRFGFCCDVDEEASLQLANLSGVISVKPDLEYNSEIRDASSSDAQIENPANLAIRNFNLFPAGSSKHWLVRMDKPTIGVVSKAQMVDHYVQILTKVLGNESDAQMCIYHISWQSNFGFCCELDEECARELVGVPGVLSVQPDEHFDSENKNYRGDGVQSPSNLLDASTGSETENVRTKKLFVTGLSFYTSEKTLRAAFEGFGELVEVKIIMDKISKRSKGYAFIEYTTEEAAGAALKEMNGKIINGWMIVVDVAKPTPPRNSRDRQRPSV